MSMRVLMIAAASAFLFACAPVEDAAVTPAAPEPPAEETAACPAAAFQSLIGQGESEIQSAALPEGTRVICHNCPVTMDYRPDRLNVELGEDGKVARVRCG